MEHIQSTKNARVKEWKKLLTKKGRDQHNLYIVEGFHLVEEAIKKATVEEIMIEEGLDRTSIPENFSITIISSEISRHISDTETPQGIFAICRKSQPGIDLSTHKRLLLFDRVQDPGNIGTMIRTAEAAGMDAVIFGEGSGDLYNPKVIRSAQGSHFHINTAIGNLHEWVEKIKEEGMPVYGTALEGASPYTDAAATDAFALIVGNEGAGVAPDLLTKTTKNLYIPIYGQSESLNVAIAAGILLYHLRK
ncbi:RNA methyltransferase [Bacillus sp. FJAT-50079]|uniref:TrmH family RNA methyltransferase n=1 Tax=Bacillus sp. FJAT-50079 TaxID=2833577 RepID=UPI001BCA2AD5|nr:RNA methyltransferase [Bacillus sp. FJAT-50079]MBS4208817.1 RNA methyltransferase [Bacillus sp. FJAT-50079]